MGTKKSAKKDLRVLVIDVGGTSIKAIVTGAEKRIKIPSVEDMSAEQMVDKVKVGVAEAGWGYDVVSLGVPCVVRNERITKKPHNLGVGWIDYDFEEAFACPVKLLNDAAMQAYGAYEGGRMLFLGFGTGLGTTLIVDGFIVPLECGHLPYEKTKRTIEDYVGKEGQLAMGPEKWIKHSLRIIKSLRHAFSATDLVIGGGNAKEIDPFPKDGRRVNNSAAFDGGFRLWAEE